MPSNLHQPLDSIQPTNSVEKSSLETASSTLCVFDHLEALNRTSVYMRIKHRLILQDVQVLGSLESLYTYSFKKILQKPKGKYSKYNIIFHY